MSKPMFSVIIPLYNKEKYIARTIENVLNQTFRDFEVYIIDDGSTDQSLKIASQYSDVRINIITQPNGGVSKARNTGIMAASGKYLAFLDADDEWTAVFLETVVELINQFPEAKVFCTSYQMKYGRRVVTPKWRSVSLSEPSLVADFFEMATAPCWVMTSSCVAIEAEAIRGLDSLFAENEKIYEDYDMWLRLGAKYKVAHSPRICGAYNRITDSNARKSGKIVYSKTFMQTIDALMANPEYSPQQKDWLKEIKDRRMVPYIFSLLLANKRVEAKHALVSWKPLGMYLIYKIVLTLGVYLPNIIVKKIQETRLKRF